VESGAITDHPHLAREYCVQYRESDLNFVQHLLEEEGIYYFFKHEEAKHTGAGEFHRRARNRPWGPTPKGKYHLGPRHHHVTVNWSTSCIAHRAPLRQGDLRQPFPAEKAPNLLPPAAGGWA